jgi:hypothetical protein
MGHLDPFAQAFHAHYSADPNARVFLGLSEDLDRLPDPSLEAASQRMERARTLLRELQTLESRNLDFDERLDARLARLKLEREIHDDSYVFNGQTRLAQLPTAGDSIGDGIFLMFVNDPRPELERLADIHARIARVPGFLTAMLGRLNQPVRRWTRVDIDKCSALPELFDTLLSWGRELNYEELARLQADIGSANSALAQYGRDLALLPTVDNIHLGEETMREILHRRGIVKSPSELREIAREFLRETAETVETLRDKLVRKHGLPESTSPAELHRWLNERFRLQVDGDFHLVLQAYEREREAVLRFCEDRELFPIFRDQSIQILKTPAFMAPSIPAGAMMPPPAFRRGTATSLVYLTLSEELLDEHTRLTIPNMMIHEGTPGHHLQYAWVSRHPSVIRRHSDCRDHAEGWTTMLEDYMLDLGYAAEMADEVRFCAKRDISRLGARVAIDLFFMSGDRKYLDVGVDCELNSEDPFVAASNLLVAVTGFVPGRAQAELNWYSIERAYPLSYLTGNRAVWELKNRLREANRGKLEGLALDRKFHEIYLKEGSVPVSFLDELFAHHGLLGAGPSPS